MAEAMLALLPQFPTANTGIAVMAGMLHDAAKCEDYLAGSDSPWEMTDWGKLVDHKSTLILWIGEAFSRLRTPLPHAHLQSLIHAVTATYAPSHLGLRKPVTPEAIMLSLADRASGKGDLMARQQFGTDGWGQPHPHLDGNAPYAIPDQQRGRLRGLEAFVQAHK